MIRLLTATLAGEGYLNFMGNEFGHPEWIDFPREGNGWSYHYCRRQWNLVDNDMLRYEELNNFDKAMVSLIKKKTVMGKKAESLWLGQEDKTILYAKGDLIFAFNFNPIQSFEGYFVPVKKAGKYKVVLSSDDKEFGGFGRVDTEYVYTAEQSEDGRIGFMCYLPARSAIVLKKVTKKK